MIAVTENRSNILNYFYGVAGDWAYYVDPSPDWVEPYTTRAFVVYRKHLFTGNIQVLADGEGQSESERMVRSAMLRSRAALLAITDESSLENLERQAAGVLGGRRILRLAGRT